MTSGADQQSPDEDPVEAILDALIYAPIGLLFDAKKVHGDLALRGRQQVRTARTIGEMAVGAGKSKLEGMMRASQATPANTEPASAAVTTSEAAAPDTAAATTVADDEEAQPAVEAKKPVTKRKTPAGKKKSAPKATSKKKSAKPVSESSEPSASQADACIPDYDSLAASQVVKRLEPLTADELEVIKNYEAASRGRRTILTKIARLQDQ